MTTRDIYLKKAQACVTAAERIRDPAEREELSKVGACCVMLADYVAARLDCASARRVGERRDIQADS